MGKVMVAIGFGVVTGTITLSMLSDRIGRKLVTLFSAIGAFAGVVALSAIGRQPHTLFACLFTIHSFDNAMNTMTVGPIAIETVPITLMTTASGLVLAAAELLGGGVAPIVNSRVAKDFGIDYVLLLPIATLGLGVLLHPALHETRPRKVNP